MTQFLADEGIDGTVVLTGDVHHFWQAPVLADLDASPRRVVAQEYVCGSVSSTGYESDVGPLANVLGQVLSGLQPPMRWVDLERRGHALLSADATAATVEYRAVEARHSTEGRARTMVRFTQRPDAELAVSGP